MTTKDIKKALNDIRDTCIHSNCEDCPYIEIVDNHDIICSIWKITRTYPDSWRKTE